jgi:L,D-peptidoglycan transpeptidase YkuD (ErfK/YbiS/YcfS/YnhG family)
VSIRRTLTILATVVTVVAVLLGVRLAGPADRSHRPGSTTAPDSASDSTAALSAPSAATPAHRAARPTLSPTIPGLGAQTLATIPAATRQVVVVAAPDAASGTSMVTEWRRTPAGWLRGRGPLPAHNGYAGWSADHHAGDGATPTGTFTLTAAGGELPDPGTRLPYQQETGYYDIGGTFMGHDLAGSFDYVLAIDYNHVPGSPPNDYRQPLGADRGQGVWFHVDHGSPTHACVSIARDQMRHLLRWLRPASHPVVVMGPQAQLAQ